MLIINLLRRRSSRSLLLIECRFELEFEKGTTIIISIIFDSLFLLLGGISDLIEQSC